jgi:hypothetical protein
MEQSESRISQMPKPDVNSCRLSTRFAIFTAVLLNFVTSMCCCREALYYRMLTINILKLRRIHRRRRYKYLRHHVSHVLRKSRQRIRIISCISYLIVYYIMLQQLLGQSSVQPESWIGNNIRWRKNYRLFPLKIRMLGRDIDDAVTWLTNIYVDIVSDGKETLMQFDPNNWTCKYLFIHLISVNISLQLLKDNVGLLECNSALALTILYVNCCSLLQH